MNAGHSQAASTRSPLASVVVSRPWRVLAALPVLGVLSAPFVANRIEPRILGLPFLLAFITGWVLLSSAIMAVIFLLDERADRTARETPRARSHET